jgi:hypothetical protein
MMTAEVELAELETPDLFEIVRLDDLGGEESSEDGAS